MAGLELLPGKEGQITFFSQPGLVAARMTAVPPWLKNKNQFKVPVQSLRTVGPL